MERESWSSNLGFILASVGSAIGLGNIWRFGYMVYTNGGGAFLIPYIVALLCVGIPLMILEFAIGHYTKKSAPLALEKLHNGAEWAGWFAVISGFIITSYYAVIIAWCLYYLIILAIYGYPSDPNAYFFHNILQISSGVEDIGGVSYGILISTLAVWGIIALILSAGVKNGLEKANKIMIPFLLFLVILLVLNALTLPGALTGIEWYLTPDFSALFDYNVWLSAFSQIFFSLSLGFGILIAYASYLPKKSDLTINAVTISLLNCGFSFLAGFAVFGTLGYMSYTSGIPLDKAVSEGIGLAFVTFPKALSLLPFASRLFGIIFFLALVFAGISSAVSIVEASVSAIMDKFSLSRKKALLAVLTLFVILSPIFTTGAGLYYLDIIDHFASGYLLPIAAILEIIIAIWLFGGDKLREHINKLSEMKLGVWWKYLAGVVSPIILTAVVLLDASNVLTSGYGDYKTTYVMFGALIIPLAFVVSVVLQKMKTVKG
ncbi:sodium:neurotransmitter symporter [Methanocaldococcus sp. FS406-22]|uniref:sodium-dependent transporter n=1 Tax=Methanocaldococcus sp. (strain FS406-22) TaxID=644281 RepID=UPI0001BF1082|nr:sodium-dependent transporter [Methanocaldococcus sp. FS406-22]ADC69079.1 sodium:neurotransmitter symporter [Methanocaldococcus sp. FS406-22]